MQRSETIGKLAAALAKAQGEMGNAAKDSNNPHFKSKYADLASVRAAVHGPFSSNGLAYVQLPRFDGDMVHVETVLMHAESGEFIGDTVSIPVMQKSAHGVGSAITYGRRFGLMAISGVAPEEDDDGNAASERPAQQPRQQWKPAPPRAEQPPADPIDEIPHTQPKEPTPQASKPIDDTPIKVNAPSKAAASVPAASPPPIRPPSRVAAIPTVAPTAKPASYSIADKLIAQLRIRKAGILKTGANLDATIEAHEAWKDEARTIWSEMEGIDQRRVKAEQSKLETDIAAAVKARGSKPSHIVKPAAPKAAISQGDEIDRETGEVLSEAAE